MLLQVLQCSGQPCNREDFLAPTVTRAEAKNPGLTDQNHKKYTHNSVIISSNTDDDSLISPTFLQRLNLKK